MSEHAACTAGFEWCQGGLTDCHDDHSGMIYQRATLGQGAPYRGDEPLLVGVGARFNVCDGDVGARVVFHIQGGPDDLDVQIDMRATEAYALSKLLDAALIDATAATLSVLPPTLAADLIDAQ
ncbi:Uncharacterised protein [Mycobacteroides abscessus subsp. abscessus]|uniref:hypothetical protein n=1 Tax=Mycobacteroides abscessus TaxID=36809 RepID=UPI0009B18AC6|nr:hypothetical protein [Mycobacteroides abscessus]SLL01238.1 Uncharacterised protein [Mycobacteroides abscessus subsp. abscessus]